jgi:hypothetical protein
LSTKISTSSPANGPRDGHDVVLSPVVGRHKNDGPWLYEREGPAQL